MPDWRDDRFSLLFVTTKAKVESFFFEYSSKILELSGG